jgi:hypothetical protein
VRVTLVRGVRRVVRVVGASSCVRAVVGSVVVSLLDVVDDVDDEEDVGDVEGPSISVVSGGLVLVIVWVVVEVAADFELVAEYVGATKSSGAGSVSPN